MKLAIATTTIHAPTALHAFRAADSDVHFFITGDRKSPDAEIVRSLSGLGNFSYYSLAMQHELGYACSDLLGDNTVARRSIALLEALRWKADAIIYWDDDNLCLDRSYFAHVRHALGQPFDGIAVSGFNGWFDVGQLLDPVAPHRGFPYKAIPLWQAKPITGAKVGVAAGICLGDPDVDAITRIANQAKPLDVHRISELLRAGIVVHPSTKTVFNSQNTSFIRELAPAFLMVPHFKRFDDILASIVAQRIMRQLDYVVRFGQPYVWQQRNPHDLMKDLTLEIWGMGAIAGFAAALDTLELPESGDVAECVRFIYRKLGEIGLVPEGVSELADAWCDDIAKVM